MVYQQEPHLHDRLIMFIEGRHRNIMMKIGGDDLGHPEARLGEAPTGSGRAPGHVRPL